jgi:hypothetical protein
MWKLIDRSKGSFINLNGDLFEIVNKTGFMPSQTTKEMEMIFELMKVGERQPAPTHRLIYMENPERLRFESLEKKSSSWKEQEIRKIGF